MQSPTIDQREVDYYARLAEQWGLESGKLWPLHRLNALRVDYLKRRICSHFRRDPAQPRPLGGLRIVDIGCGGGILAESMARLGAEVHGIDVVEKNIEVARRHARQSELPIDYRQVTVEDLAASGEHYDVVLNMEVVEHVADLPLFMSACNRLLGARGLQFIATINRNPWSWLIAIVGAEYILGWLPRGTHRWSRFVRPDELEALLRRDGLHIDDKTGVAVNPLNRNFSLTRRLAVNYMLCASRGSNN